MALALAVTVAMAWPSVGALSDEEATAKFEAANILYEKGQFEPAARAYEALITGDVRTASLLFNAGNAWFKAGETGRAVTWWLQAEALEPRNDRIQVNLEFARKSVNGGALPLPHWPAPLRLLTLDEWAGAVLVAGWWFFGALTMMTWKPARRAWFRLPATLGGVALVVTLVLLVITVRDRTDTVVAVVIKDEAVVRYGPLPESQSAFVARDGTEFVVTDRKDAWLRVQDHQGRFGWLLESQVVQLRAGRVWSEAAAPGRTEPLQALVETAPGLVR